MAATFFRHDVSLTKAGKGGKGVGLLAPGGWLFLKTFSHQQPGDQGPYRFAPDEVLRIFGGAGRFQVMEVVDTVYQGQRDPWPKALLAIARAA